LTLDRLWAGWRMAYIDSARSKKAGKEPCLFCGLAKAKPGPKNLVLAVTPRVLVMMNLFPYNTAHVMVAPTKHVGTLARLDAGDAAEMSEWLGRVETAIGFSARTNRPALRHRSANAVVIITGNAAKARSQGYWKSQYDGKPPNDFTTAKLSCFLQVVSFMSSVYEGLTPAQAYAILASTSSEPRPLLSKQLLAAWLNFANGSYDLGTPVDTNGDNVNDSTFGAVLAAAEAVYNNPSATKPQLVAQQKILERINLRDGG